MVNKRDARIYKLITNKEIKRIYHSLDNYPKYKTIIKTYQKGLGALEDYYDLMKSHHFHFIPLDEVQVDYPLYSKTEILEFLRNLSKVRVYQAKAQLNYTRLAQSNFAGPYVIKKDYTIQPATLSDLQNYFKYAIRLAKQNADKYGTYRHSIQLSLF